jgi:hypothetical protein
MTFTDFKIYLLNTTVFLATLSEIEPILKVSLLIVSIGYTLNRWFVLNLNKKKNEDNK